jgi:hypothetical protein
MLLSGGQVAWDPDLDLLVEVLAVVDSHLTKLGAMWKDASEADELGYFDRMEHMTGLGFVACQCYLVSICGHLDYPKSMALLKGPRHQSGHTVVEIINHAANYWKHYDEWHLDKGQVRQERVRNAFGSMGFSVDTEYPLNGVLAALVSPSSASFAPLVSALTEWREALRNDVL